MIVCPVCEHPQEQGFECDVCGKRLVPGVSPADLAIPVVEGLEPTLQSPVDAREERVPDLEPTLRDAGDAMFADDPTPDLEATSAAPVDVVADLAPDIERTDAGIPDDAPTPMPEFVTCRYCRTPAQPGERLCARCGVRLPVLPQRLDAGGGVGAGTEPPLRICSCGASVRWDAALCPTCGARLR
jgi:hypothetical protein